MSRRVVSCAAALIVAGAAFLYGAVDDGPPLTNADRSHTLAQGFACPVCSGQSVAESDVPVAREIRRQIAVWVDEGRTDGYIRDRLVAAYDVVIDYKPSMSGLTGLVWVLPVLAAAGIAAALAVMLRGGGRDARVGVWDAQVGRSSGGRDASAVSAPDGRRLGVVVAWVAAVGVFAVVSGVLVARFAGSRGADGSITGNIRSTVREVIFEAQRSLQSGDIEAAIQAYDEALEMQPSNVEALTYRGWLTSRAGDTATAVVYLEDAIAVDPDYPDARLFRAIVALDQDDGVRAAFELAAFDGLDPPVYAERLLAQAQVRSRVAAARNTAALRLMEDVYSAEDRPAFDVTDFTTADAVAASEALAVQGGLLEAVKLLDWVLRSYPDDVDALVGRGWLLVRSGESELVDRGIGYLDSALAVDTDNSHALVYRAFARLHSGDIDGARVDLAAFDVLESRPPELIALITTQSLRDALNSDSFDR